jgi:hypothetical protein
MRRTKRGERYGRIVLAYVRALGRRLPENPNDLLPAIFAAVPDTSVEEIADAIRWAIRESNRKAVKFERTFLKVVQ